MAETANVTLQGELQDALMLTSGQNGRKFQWGTFKFKDTDAACLLAVRMQTVEACIFTPVGGAADEIVYGPSIPEGKLAVAASGKITVTRTGASKTDDLEVNYLIIGY